MATGKRSQLTAEEARWLLEMVNANSIVSPIGASVYEKLLPPHGPPTTISSATIIIFHEALR